MYLNYCFFSGVLCFDYDYTNLQTYERSYLGFRNKRPAIRGMLVRQPSFFIALGLFSTL